VMTEICQRHGAADVLSTADEEEGELFVMARRMVIPAVETTGRLLLEDVGVPLPRLPELVAGIEKIAVDRSVTIALIAHAGDGNTHPLIVFDPSDPQMEARAQLAFGEIMELAIELGGTITGEHGVGRLKRPWLEAQIGPDVMALSERIKGALDPLNILNPGAIFS
jgi:glycolate oxidase